MTCSSPTRPTTWWPWWLARRARRRARWAWPPPPLGTSTRGRDGHELHLPHTLRLWLHLKRCAQPATSATLNSPGGVAVDVSGNLYIADTTDNMVAMVAGSACSSSCPLGLASTSGGDVYMGPAWGRRRFGGMAAWRRAPRLTPPSGVAVDSAGDLFVADSANQRVRMVPASSGTFFGQAMTRGVIYTVAGTGTACSTHSPAGCGYTSSGGVAQAATSAGLDVPSGVATDSSGNLYIADTADNMVAMVAAATCSSACPFGLPSTTTGDIYTIAGTGTAIHT